LKQKSKAVRSASSPRPFRVEPLYQRYAVAKTCTNMECERAIIYHQLRWIAQGKTLRIVIEKAATIHWSFDKWATANDLETP